MITEFQKNKIIEEYQKQEKTYREIGDDIGLKEQAVSDFIRREIKRGNLERISRSEIRKEKIAEARIAKEETKRVNGIVEHIPVPNTDVNCNKVFKTCIYGCRGNSGKCNFLAMTGFARITTSPNPKHCHDYIKATGKRPRLTKGALG